MNTQTNILRRFSLAFVLYLATVIHIVPAGQYDGDDADSTVCNLAEQIRESLFAGISSPWISEYSSLSDFDRESSYITSAISPSETEMIYSEDGVQFYKILPASGEWDESASGGLFDKQNLYSEILKSFSSLIDKKFLEENLTSEFEYITLALAYIKNLGRLDCENEFNNIEFVGLDAALSYSGLFPTTTPPEQKQIVYFHEESVVVSEMKLKEDLWIGHAMFAGPTGRVHIYNVRSGSKAELRRAVFSNIVINKRENVERER